MNIESTLNIPWATFSATTLNDTGHLIGISGYHITVSAGTIRGHNGHNCLSQLIAKMLSGKVSIKVRISQSETRKQSMINIKKNVRNTSTKN